MPERYDILSIGCGIAGGALTTVMAREGYSVLALERAAVYRDRVRGEWLAPWGVVETQRLGLYDTLLAAGGHHIKRHMSAGDTVDAADPTARFDFATLLPHLPSPLALGHPRHCETLHDAAVAAGARVLRDVREISITPGDAPSVTYVADGKEHTAECRLIVGADGRGSMVRRAAGIELHSDPPHHFFCGLLVEGAHGWPEDLELIGTERDVNFFVFPQGGGKARLYLGYARDQGTRFNGEDGPRAFLDAFRLECAPETRHIAEATPAGPCNSYPNEDTWTDEPFAPGVVLVGDSAGWNDPTIGQGLSIAYRDVRIVTELLGGAKEWTPALFAPYAEERSERMRRLRFAGGITAQRDAEFGDEGHAQRVRAAKRQATDPVLALPGLATVMGPESLPPAAFEAAVRERIFAP